MCFVRFLLPGWNTEELSLFPLVTCDHPGACLFRSSGVRSWALLRAVLDVLHESMGNRWIDNSWLVVWLPSFLFSHQYWVSNHPNWRTHIFQRGKPTTNQTALASSSGLPREWVTNSCSMMNCVGMGHGRSSKMLEVSKLIKKWRFHEMVFHDMVTIGSWRLSKV